MSQPAAIPNLRRKSSRRLSNKPKQKKKKKEFSRADQLSRIEMYEQEDLNNHLNQKFQPFEGFHGAKTDRHVTDVLCLPILIVLVVALILHAIICINIKLYFQKVVTLGNINMLQNGVDFRGETCGINGLVHLPYLYYGSPSKDVNLVWCVQECPISTGRNICLYDTDHFTITPFCYVQMTSDKIGKVCLPQEPINRAIVDEQFNQLNIQVRRVASDLWTARDLIIISVILISVVGFILTNLLSHPKIVLVEVWLAIWGSLVCFIVLAYLFWREYQRVIQQRCLFHLDKHNCGGQRAILFQFLTLVSTIIGFIYLVYVMKLFNKINNGIGLIKASSRVNIYIQIVICQVVDVLMQLRFFAIFIGIFGILVLCIVFVMVMYGLTIGTIIDIEGFNIDGGVMRKYYINSLAGYTLPFPAFMATFLLLFGLNVNNMFNSYALSVWFFTKKKDVVEVVVIQHQDLIDTPKYCFEGIDMASFRNMCLPNVYGDPIYHTQIYYVLCASLFEKSTLEQSIGQVPVGMLSLLPWYPLALFKIHIQTCIFVGGCLVRTLFIVIREGIFFAQSKSGLGLGFRFPDRVYIISVETILPIYIYLTLAETTPLGDKISNLETPLVPTLFVFGLGFFFTSVFQGTYDICMDREMFYAEQRYVEDFIQKFMDFYGKAESKKIQLQSKQTKYSAKVAPLQQKVLKAEEAEEDEEDDVDNFKKVDHDDDDDDEDDLEDLESVHRQNVGYGVKPKMGHLIDVDPFELGGNNNPITLIFKDNEHHKNEVKEEFYLSHTLFDKNKYNGTNNQQNVVQAPRVQQFLSPEDLGMGNAIDLRSMMLPAQKDPKNSHLDF